MPLMSINLVLLALITVCGYLYVVFDHEAKEFDPGFDATMLSMEAQYENLFSEYTLKVDEAAAMEAYMNELTDSIAMLQGELAVAETLHQTAADTLSAIQTEYETLSAEIDDVLSFPERIAEFRTEYGTKIRELEDKINAGESDYKICYLTFDDGPCYITNEFLDTLKSYGAYATFFTCNVNLPEHQYELRNSLFRQEAMNGHTVANHSFTHSFAGALYSNLETFLADVQAQDDLVYSLTGMHTQIFRFPSGSYYCGFRSDAIAALNERGMEYLDWRGNAFDAGSNGYSASYTADVIVSQARTEDIIVILCHDWQYNTLLAIDTAIPKLQEENYLFLPLFIQSCTMGDNTVPRWG